MIEAEIHYIAEALLYMDANKIPAVDVKRPSFEKFSEDLQWKLKHTVWQSGGCGGRFKDEKGNNMAMWPGFTWEYVLSLKQFDHGNYNFL